ncbi:hypothetical protein GCM10010964_00930 [Caldovatus sediminis]|uniref:Cell division protein FtsL n=1 Tax=Caldovatus sediminis TaxID=2041189 RepID=A0A8J2Z7U2_9PROT|nr:hypothetical protein [Caldovatus sediminis]GGG16431.1 hypothetical protein GCM10010964_00930 [Caldovatus sediminis]
MIRPLTLVSLLAAGGAGLYLYQVKHSVSLLDRELRDLHRRIEAVREHTRVLHAEWALLNEPERLRQVAERYLSDLVPMAPAQFVRPQDLERRLPQPVAFAGAPAPFGSPLLAMPDAPAPGPEQAGAAVVVAAAPPSRPAGAGSDGGRTAPTAGAPGRAATETATVVAPLAAATVAMAAARGARAGEARPAAAPPPAAVGSVPAVPGAAAPARPRGGERPPRTAAEAPPAAVVPAAVSALGGAPSRALAPPVPFGAVGAAVAASFPPPAPPR